MKSNTIGKARAVTLQIGLTIGVFAAAAEIGMAQTVDFKADLPGLRLNNPELGRLGLQIKLRPPKKQDGPFPPRPSPEIDPRKSIFITDINIMKKLTFAEVMDQLAKQGGDPRIDKLTLFQQWWDSQTTASEGLFAGPHCQSTINRFNYECPRPEATEARSDPFTNPEGEQGYSAIAYSNRPDLTDPENPTDCGEARVVFARNSGKLARARNLIIFEARIRNPSPRLGLEGCRVIQLFWYELSKVSQDERGNRLKKFFLNGIPDADVGPVIHIDNLSAGTGQIRTNQFIGNPGSTLREFKIQKLQPGIRFVPVTVKTNPDSSLFSGGAPIELQARFIARLADEFSNLRGNGNEVSASAFGLRLSQPTDDAFNPFESNDQAPEKGSLIDAFNRNPNGLVGMFITKKLNELSSAGGTRLNTIDIVQRIQTHTCAGCHRWSADMELGGGAGKWPGTLQSFTHESEEVTEPSSEGGDRYAISPALKSNGFIPLRCAAMSHILSVDDGPCGFTP